MLKGALVTPETGAGGGEEGDVSGAADPHDLPVLVPDLVISDKPLDDFGQSFAVGGHEQENFLFRQEADTFSHARQRRNLQPERGRWSDFDLDWPPSQC